MPFSWQAKPEEVSKALTVRCPACGARPGDQCVQIVTRRLMRRPHASRIQKAGK